MEALDAGARHDLLDLGAVEPVRRLGERLQIEARRVLGRALQVNPEDLQPLVLPRQPHEEDLVEAPLPEHLRRQQIDHVGRGGHEHERPLLLHPVQKRREHPRGRSLARLLRVDRDARLDLVDPEHTGRSRLGDPDRGRERLLRRRASFSGVQARHVEAQQRQVPVARDRLAGEALPAARDAREEHALWERQPGARRVQRMPALHEPRLEHLETADVLEPRRLLHEIERRGAPHELALVLGHGAHESLVQHGLSRERLPVGLHRLALGETQRRAPEGAPQFGR